MTNRNEIEETPAGDGHWSQQVTESSHALDLEAGVFALTNPREIALSLKNSADNSRRRKSGPFRSAMSMLTFYINRAGQHIHEDQRKCLEEAKDELRALYGRRRKNPGRKKESSHGKHGDRA